MALKTQKTPRPARSSPDGVISTRTQRDLAPGTSRVDHAYRRILAHITEGLLAEGDRLPSESDMAASFGVSRPVIREALTRLQQAGIIEVRWGAGSYIVDPDNAAQSNASFGPLESLEELRHIFELRMELEGSAAAFAARRRTPSGLATIRRAFDKLEAAIETQALAGDADLEFHLAIAAASENPLFSRLLTSIQRPMSFSISLGRTLSLTHPKARLRLVQAEHSVILDAIENGREEAARSAMSAHLGNACRRIFQGPPSEPPKPATM